MTNDLGTLVVVVLKARNLPDKHTFYKQDVYGQIQLSDVTKKTAADVKGGQHPVWDEEIRIPVPAKTSEGTRTLQVSCWSPEPRGAEVVGKGKIDLAETLRTGEFDDWIPLEIDGVFRGELYLEMTFYAAGPPPSLSRRPSKLTPKDRVARLTHTYAHQTPANKGADGSYAKGTSPRPAPAKDTALPTLPEEEPGAVPPTIPSILRAGPGKPPNSPPHTIASGPILPPSTLAGAPAALRPGRPLMESVRPHVGHSPTSGYDSFGYTPNSLSSSPPGSYLPPVGGRDPQPHVNTPPILRAGRPTSQVGYPPGGDISSYPLTSSPPQTYAVPALPRDPQPSSGLAYASPYLRSERPPSQSEYLAYAESQPYGDQSSFFPVPQVPSSPPSRPYPYNYAPPPRDPDLDVPPPRLGPQQHGNSLSFPLPDEPDGAATPTPMNPHGYSSPSRQPPPPLPSKQASGYDLVRNAEQRHSHQHTYSGSSVGPSLPPRKSQEQSDRDRMLALAFEREEDERKKYLAEQEQHDMELAKKLDFELNLDDPGRAESETVLSSGRRGMGGRDMPGGW